MIAGKLNSKRSIRIAVVDDHAGCRSGICRLLERHGFATCGFGSVPAFIASNELGQIDGLILDVGLPDIDGITLHSCLRKTNFDFPIIFCTGQEMDERLESALAHGAFALLKKPVRIEALLETVHAACASGAGQPQPSSRRRRAGPIQESSLNDR